MKKTISFILLAIGIMAVSCKKDDPVTPSPTINESGTLTFIVKTKGGVVLSKENDVLYQTPNGTPRVLDTTFVYTGLKDSTRFDLVLFHRETFQSELEVKFNGISIFDTVISASTPADGYGFTYFVNRNFWFSN